MRFPNVLFLLPLVIPRVQSHPTLTGNVESFAGLLVSPAPVALALPQRTFDAVLTHFHARKVSSASAFDTSTLPASAVSSSLDSSNGASGTFHLRDATPDPSGVCQGLIEDLDITGLGVRISFYLTSILTVINACIPDSDMGDSPWPAFINFAALMVSASLQTANHSISLYNAIIVMHLCYLYVLCDLLLAVAPLFRKAGEELLEAPFVLKKDWPDKIFPLFRMFLLGGFKAGFFVLPFWFWYGFGLYVWAHASRFGSQPECNAATKMIVFGGEFSAVGSGRHVSIVLVGVSLILIGGPSSLLNAFFPSFSSPGADPGISAKLIKDLIHNTTFIMLPFLFQWIYVVVTIEQIIQRNPVIHSGPRFPITFGQILPVVTVSSCLVSIIQDTFKAIFKIPRPAQLKQMYNNMVKAIYAWDKEGFVKVVVEFRDFILDIQRTRDNRAVERRV